MTAVQSTPGVLLLAVIAAATGCATGGGTPRPFPQPSARVRTVPPPDTETPAAAGVAPGGETGAMVISTATGVLGVPYRAGGDTPDRGFDCSGFVAWVYGRHGVALPRTVAWQFAAGQALPAFEAPAPGDLVFFNTDGRGASHVGIALDAARFVHAPSSRGVVRIETLTSPYWSRRFVGARRVLPPSEEPHPGPPSQ